MHFHHEPVEPKVAPVVITGHSAVKPAAHKEDEYDFVGIEDVTHEIQHEEDSLSLEKKEKEMIIKALVKNNHKRKYAAQDLGISERTLYRKIKQYGIEE
jgi:transcriptional regulator of acetoin/glycerol metabolism